MHTQQVIRRTIKWRLSFRFPLFFVCARVYILSNEIAYKLNVFSESVCKLQAKKNVLNFSLFLETYATFYKHIFNRLDCLRRKNWKCRDANGALLYCFHSRPMIRSNKNDPLEQPIQLNAIQFTLNHWIQFIEMSSFVVVSNIFCSLFWGQFFGSVFVMVYSIHIFIATNVLCV